ncbi:prolipoprotein diacylglyceryl transferase [Staphylococcus intermedius]|uniref:Phosphatidylglycerol--prolipoprotein diacylglyceryl transferase n=1 Tax=Staphylococcus intermedius NCTC 11048 TaxID=1141106 RepID=A0A380GB17_STAIN|nr:prolipoprotein diacylglyceryl transferase [Staphylococcus intermedius]PCF65438.1 prolipoprotein diacylglyceryl transferase [Staphylococcus intermedius]PCF81116.1 prolipoprotein diacylglyceryl transferase [Staphylococcus intermedius]PCF82398.1 prolipoprotein diacylglyceryl transferase [Staphylococcus intermedius]PCF87099.1 prolipoprotein diacylglyceryl transferase [Staphylococcus intermedius]PCF87657.1 prolipoprotein diacylglyceryl transferase [Staphylococcus intermedius]
MIGYIDPVAFSLGGLEVKWYGIIIASAILIGYWIAQKSAQSIGFREDDLVNILLICVFVAILSARLYFVLFQLDYYIQNPIEIPMIWHGGIAIHGGLIGAFAMGIYYCYRKNWHPFQLGDIVAPSIILAQGIGRWGNFMNHEAHGGPVSRSFLESLHLPEFIIDNMRINGIYYQPTFLYESIWDVIGFVILISIRRHLKIGETFFIYIIWYSIGRFYIEGLRTDSLMLTETIRIAQAVSIVCIIIGVFFIVWRRLKKDVPYYREVGVLNWPFDKKGKR